ncbi:MULTISPECIES: VCBS domain-containing protein [Pseudomonas]|uniref:VCBS domain-containing protein n=1 Tax=Pseudomonas wuhanensis TaxID=2954098 RepID=A0ABY9GMV2_9PSED|nr:MULTISPECIES: VCBS domain-containing protein [unclassified Pseudomonas]WLI11224.1 VCBS domain-containing protein [Pseudomonas sp. FP603]WLI17058.1 VCBS domain-containing protein [Pseudomonas sp. FP607]
MATTTTTSGGTVTSLSNTPQAQDDIFTTGVIGTSSAAITEDLLGVVYLDVMSNDLGGSAKTLWSLDDATSLSTATKVYAPADLLVQDTGRIEATSTDTSFNGAKIWITSDGKVGYDAATLSTAFKAQLQALAGGASLTDSFTYAIRLGNGTLSWATAQVQFAGANDSVTMSLGAQAGTVTEDATATPSLTDSLSATGTIAFSDVDLSDTHTASFVAAGGNTTALGNFALASVTEAANAANGTVDWTYTLNNAAAQTLAQGQTATETYVVTINDGHGSSTTQNVTITITGTNDQVQITSGVQAGDAGEDSGDYAASGSITFTDVDLIDTHSVTVTPGASGYLGSFTTDPLSDSTGTGSGSLGWNFAVNNAALQFLGEGQSVTQTYNVAIGDGAVQTVTITITGTNDQVQITSGVQAGDAGEDSSDYAASGSITFTDADLIDTHSVSVTPGASGYLGNFTTDPLSDSTGTGSGSLGWNFAVNNAALQFLGEGQSVTQTYNMAIGDGAVQTVTITITGTNDQVQITSGVQAGDAGEDSGDYAASGSITFTDADLIDTHSVTVTPGTSGYLGNFTTDPLSDSTGTGSGSLGWNFAVDNAALQFLGEGQSVTQTYNVAIGDGAVQTVTITITGTNDQVQITSGVQAGDAKEDSGDYAASGSITFTDVDLIDTHSVTVTPGASGYLGSFTTDPLSDSTDTGSGSLGWNFAVNNAALQFLGEGQSVTQTYNVAIGDGAVQTVTITITGTNDQPTLTITDTTGAMNEGNGTATLSDSGALSFADLDSTDTVTVSQTANGDIAWSGGVLNATMASALVAGFSVDQNSWDYSSNQNLDFLGAGETITFSYAVVATDDSGAANAASATQTVTITITGTNDAPVLSFATGNDAGAVQEDTTLSVSGQFSSADIDHAATATWTIAGSNTGTYGSIAVDSTGQWTYTLANGTDGVASAVQSLKVGESHDEVFSVQVSDGLGGVDTQLVTVTVSGTNDAPVLSFATGNDAGAVQEDTTLSVSGQFSSADIDHAATATWSIAGSNAGTYGSIAVDNTGKWTYTLANGTDGVASAVQSLGAGESHDEVFSVQVSDGFGGVDTQLVTVTVTGTNDAAVLSSANVTLTETDAPLTTGGSLTVSDIDSPESFQAQTNTAGGYGQFSIGTNGAWSYVADSAHNEFAAGTTYTDTFAVSSADGTLTSVTVHILGSNDAAVLSADIVNLTENDAPLTTNGSLTISDVDSAATFVAQSNTAGSYGQFSLGTDGAWSYVADSAHNEFVAGTTYTDTFAVSSADGTLTSVTVHILGSNDAAVLSSASVTLTETNAPLTTGGSLTISDVDSPETFQAQSGTAGVNGTFAIDVAGNWSYTANSAFDTLNVGDSLTDTFTVLSTDGTATAVTVTINGSNDSPTITSNGGGVTASVSVAENSTVVTTVAASDADLPAQPLSYSIVGGADAAKFSIVSGTGALTFVSAPNFESPTDSGTNNVYDVIVRASDGTLFDDQAIAVSVTGVNDNNPVITSNGGGATASVSVAENTTAVTTVMAIDADLPAQTLSYSILNTAGTDFSKFSISSSGVLTFNSAPNYENAQDVGGADGDNAYVVDVLVSDGNGGTDTQTITVNVQNVVDTPVDTVAPTVTVTGTALGNSIGSVSTVTFQFSEAVSGFNLSDVTVSASGATPRGTWSNFTQVDGDTYTATLTRTLGGSVKVDVTANSYTDLAGNAGAAGSSANLPAGVAGEPINLALNTPSADISGPITVSISGVPSGWIFNAGTDNGDGTWTVQTSDPGALTVTTPSDFAGALVLDVNMYWSNSDGSDGSAYVFNNIEVYAPGSPIFALSADDNLTGSSGADTFVFAQPIGNNQIYSFDATADKIDLIGFTGITSFADLSITNDENGNALVSISSGQSVTLKGVDAADLSESNFQFDVDPVMTNTGTLTIADGAIMPFGGSIHNSGTLELGSTGSETNLEILFRGATLTGGGQVLLSDSAQNVIFGGSADTVLTNVDNRISGAGQLGAGQMVLVNAGLILASGLNSLVLDTGTHTITNSGVLESTGEGGMTVASAVDNSGHLWANGGDMRLLADVMGNGSATIDGDATLTFSGAAHGSVAFHGEGAGTLVIAQAEAAGSLVGILGLESDDMLTFGDLAFGANTQLRYSANASGTGGLLTVDDGMHRAAVNLLGHYTVEDFQATDGGETGTQVSYNGASSGTLVGSMAADVLSGGDGNDILAGRGGEDTLSGGAGADMFAYLNEAEGGDTILDYNFAEGDALDLSALLSANFVSGISQASDFVQLAQSGSDITVKVDADGAANGTNFADVAVLANTGTSGTDLVRTWFGEGDHTLTA